MKTRQVIGISMFSSLLTIVMVFAFLAFTNGTFAQAPEPPEEGETDTGGAPAESIPDTNVYDPDKDPGEWFGAEAVADPDIILLHPEQVSAPEDTITASPAYLHISGSAFTPLFSDTGATYDTGGCLHTTGTVGHSVLNYGIVLPYAATITSLRVYYNDTNGSVNGTLRLRRMDDGNGYTEITSVSSSGNSGVGYASVTGLTHTIDYVNYSYVVQWYPGVASSTMQLCGFRIGYTTPTTFGLALPLVEKNP